MTEAIVQRVRTASGEGPTAGSTEAGDTPHVRVAIVGAGFAGLGLAIRLRQRGSSDFVVFERGDDVGGTWHDNTYPGCRCDVPSHLYSFSFAPNPRWSQSFSPQPEIEDYLRRVAREHGVMPHVRLRHELLSAEWDEAAAVWRIQTSGGSWTADVLAPAVGALSEPATPKLPGLDTFEGTVFHSARWNHDHDLTGERVAVIGTGASAIQIVPQIQPKVARLEVFQRTAPWVLPRREREFSAIEKRVFTALPAVQKLVRAGIYWGRELYVLGFTSHPKLMEVAERIALRHLAEQVPDPQLRAKLTPGFRIGCKRILLANDYYPALAADNTDVVTDPIQEVTRNGIVTSDGSLHEVDTIILATGFQVSAPPVATRITGAGGRTLAQTWSTGMAAYLGTTVAGFPNMFFLVGPNTGLGHSSMVFMIESQVAYILDALRLLDATGCRAVDVRPDVQESYNTALQQRLQGTVWNNGGCVSWYLDSSGRNTTLWPEFTWRYRWATRKFDSDSYVVRAPRPAKVPASAGGAA